MLLVTGVVRLWCCCLVCWFDIGLRFVGFGCVAVTCIFLNVWVLGVGGLLLRFVTCLVRIVFGLFGLRIRVVALFGVDCVLWF